MDVTIRIATEADLPLILDLIKSLAEFEQLSHAVTATEEGLRASLFGKSPAAEVLIACVGDALPPSPEATADHRSLGGGGQAVPVGFALFFHNFSTFVGKRGLYLEDLFVKQEWRGRGVGQRLLVHLAQLAIERDCGRFEWAVLDWNEPAIRFYKGLGAKPMHEWTVFRVDGEDIQRLAAKAR